MDPAEKARLVEVGKIDMTDKVFRILSHDEVKALIEAALAD
ncbi:MAG: hypothetical protein ACTSPE_11550 [Candidatus Thorarchaeota archaeon]